MASPKQIKANRKNSRKSTGPRSAKGKNVAKMNAQTHGFTSNQIVVPGENPDEFDDLRESLEREFNPVGYEERLLVETIAVCSWRRRRLYIIEAGILAYEQAQAEYDKAREELNLASDELNVPLNVYLNLKENPKAQKKLDPKQLKVEEAQKKLRSVSASLGMAFRRDSEGANALTKLIRHETAIERSLNRARHELGRLQAAREDVKTSLTIDGTAEKIPPDSANNG